MGAMARLSAVYAVPLATMVLVAATTPVLADGGAAHQTKQPSPVQMGTSGGSAKDISKAFCCGGTLGSLVNFNGALYLLSNNHILARSGSAQSGEDTLQPGLIDSSCRATGNIVGDFEQNYVPLGSGNVDAAVSRARAGMVDATGAILDVGVPCSVPKTSGLIKLAILKSGRTTGCVNGTVQAINLNVSIQYQAGCNKGKKFVISYANQVSTTNISAGGDSGSLILSQGGLQPVALLYAGSSSVTIGNPIEDVINAFGGGFSFVGTGSCLNRATCPESGGPPAGESAAAADRRPAADDVESARAIKERHEPDLFARPGVIGVGVGADDQQPEEPVIVVYVETGAGAALPRGFPEELDGIKVKVIPTDPIVAQAACDE